MTDPVDEDNRLVPVGACPGCDKHMGQWEKLLTVERRVEGPERLYGYLRRLRRGEDNTATGVELKQIRNRDEWDQLCMHHQVERWLINGRCPRSQQTLRRALDFNVKSKADKPMRPARSQRESTLELNNEEEDI